MNSWSRSNRKSSEQHWCKFQSHLISTSTLAKELWFHGSSACFCCAHVMTIFDTFWQWRTFSKFFLTFWQSLTTSFECEENSWCARNKLNKHHLKIWENRRATADTWWGRQPKAKTHTTENWELSSRPLTQHLMMGVVTTQRTESNRFTLKTYYKIGHRVQEMLHLDLFSSVSNVCIFPVFTGPPGESSCTQKRESPDHTLRKKQGQFFCHQCSPTPWSFKS